MITTPRPPSVRLPPTDALGAHADRVQIFLAGIAGIKAHKKSISRSLRVTFRARPQDASRPIAQKAAPVVDCESRLPASGFRAVVVNSGNANALTGKAGMQDVASVKQALGAALQTKNGIDFDGIDWRHRASPSSAENRGCRSRARCGSGRDAGRCSAKTITSRPTRVQRSCRGC